MRKGWIIALAIFLLIISVALGISVYNKNKTDNTNIVDNKKLAEENEINNVVPTAVVEEKVSPNAKVLQKQYFTGCDHLLKETKDIPENLVNKNKEEVEKYYKDWNVDSFSKNEIIIYKEEIKAAFYELTKTTNLYEYGKDIIYSTERMSLNKNVLNQKYYVVIPYYPEELGENNFDKQEITNMAFSELYTRAQSIIRTLGVCGVNGRVLNSNDLVDLLYVAYNRDDAEVYGVDKAIESGYDELYSTAPDVVDKKMRALNEQIERKAFDKANEKVIEAKSEKELAYEKKEESMDDLIDQMAKLIISQNKQIVGKDIAESAIEKVNQDTAKRRGRPKKQTTNVEGGTEDGQEEKTKRRNDTKSA